MPKDVFGRQTNVKKAEKAAYKIKDAAERPGRGQKKLAKMSARDMGFSRGLEKSDYSLKQKEDKDISGKKYTVKNVAAKVAAGRTRKKVDPNRTKIKVRPGEYLSSTSSYGRRDGEAGANRGMEKASVSSRAMVTGLKAGTVKRAVKAGERKAVKGVAKVYKNEKKLAKAEETVNRS